jgi:hypothetical protein
MCGFSFGQFNEIEKSRVLKTALFNFLTHERGPNLKLLALARTQINLLW